jgi:hypothetical protein
MPKINSVEDLILKSRLDGYSFCQLSKEKKRYATDNIMLRGAAISGCALPETEFFATYISEELEIFISDFGFEELTLSELLLALRLNSKNEMKYTSGDEITNVQFSGKCFNVDFFSKVLRNYMILRNNLDRKIQNHIDGY